MYGYTTTRRDPVNVYFNYRRHVNNDFHYAVYDYFPRRPVNVYLHYGP